MAIPSRQKPGGEVRKVQPSETPRSARLHKPDHMGLANKNTSSHSRGKGQK